MRVPKRLALLTGVFVAGGIFGASAIATGPSGGSLIMKTSEHSIPIACAPFALTREERTRSQELRRALGAAVRHVDETPSGYVFHYEDQARVLQQLTEWIPMERRCCPFLTFELQWTAGGPTTTLTLSGPEGTKGFLKAELPELPLKEVR